MVNTLSFVLEKRCMLFPSEKRKRGGESEREREWEKRTRDQFDISHFNTRYDSLDASRSTYHTKCDSFIYEHTYPARRANTQEHGDIFSRLPFVCEMLHKNAIIKCNKIKFRTQFIFLVFALSRCGCVCLFFASSSIANEAFVRAFVCVTWH